MPAERSIQNYLRENPQFEASHSKEEVGVVLAVDGREGRVPVNSRHGTRHPAYKRTK